MLSFRHTNKQAKNVADATFKRFCLKEFFLKLFIRSDLSANAGLAVTFCIRYNPDVSLVVVTNYNENKRFELLL